jgi:hypothetical protein
LTVTAWPLSADSVTGKDATPPSVTAEALPIETAGGASSSVIVLAPCPDAIVALLGVASVTVKVSAASSSRSLLVAIEIGLLVWPGANVTVPLVVPLRSAALVETWAVE